MDALLKWLEEVNAKLPVIPVKGKEVLVKIAPYVAIISLIAAIPALLAILGMGSYITAMNAQFGMTGGYGSGMGLYWIFAAAQIVLYFLAVPGLFKKTQAGWNFMFYAVLVSAVGQLLGGNIVACIVVLAIELYLLMQVRHMYSQHVI